MAPRRSIVEVKVLDVQKRRVPNKHYVSAAAPRPQRPQTCDSRGSGLPPLLSPPCAPQSGLRAPSPSVSRAPLLPVLPVVRKSDPSRRGGWTDRQKRLFSATPPPLSRGSQTAVSGHR
jgi:hypothetical protein